MFCTLYLTLMRLGQQECLFPSQVYLKISKNFHTLQHCKQAWHFAEGHGKSAVDLLQYKFARQDCVFGECGLSKHSCAQLCMCGACTVSHMPFLPVEPGIRPVPVPHISEPTALTDQHIPAQFAQKSDHAL